MFIHFLLWPSEHSTWYIFALILASRSMNLFDIPGSPRNFQLELYTVRLYDNCFQVINFTWKLPFGSGTYCSAIGRSTLNDSNCRKNFKQLYENITITITRTLQERNMQSFKSNIIGCQFTKPSQSTQSNFIIQQHQLRHFYSHQENRL